MHTYTYIHTYIHIYLQTYLQTLIHRYIHAYIHTYIHTYIHCYTILWLAGVSQDRHGGYRTALRTLSSIALSLIGTITAAKRIQYTYIHTFIHTFADYTNVC